MKNTNKKAKTKKTIEELAEIKEQVQEKDILFSCQIEKSDFKKLLKEQVKRCLMWDKHILRAIRFELDDNILIMASTDGNTLLETKVVSYSYNGKGFGVYDALYLSKINFMKNVVIKSESYVDMLQLNFKEDCLEIKDLANGIIYNVPSIDGQYPDYKHLIPEIKKDDKEYTTIAVNMRFLAELNKLSPNPRTGIVEISFKNNSPLSCIVAKCDAVEVQTRALIMPVQVR